MQVSDPFWIDLYKPYLGYAEKDVYKPSFGYDNDVEGNITMCASSLNAETVFRACAPLSLYCI